MLVIKIRATIPQSKQNRFPYMLFKITMLINIKLKAKQKLNKGQPDVVAKNSIKQYDLFDFLYIWTFNVTNSACKTHTNTRKYELMNLKKA